MASALAIAWMQGHSDPVRDLRLARKAGSAAVGNRRAEARPRARERAPPSRAFLEPGLLEDRRHVGIGHEVLVALLVPVENHPDPAVVIGIAKHVRTLGPVLLSLLSALWSRTCSRSGRNPRPSPWTGSSLSSSVGGAPRFDRHCSAPGADARYSKTLRPRRRNSAQASLLLRAMSGSRPERVIARRRLSARHRFATDVARRDTALGDRRWGRGASRSRE